MRAVAEFLGLLSEADRAELERIGHRKSADRPDLLLARGDPADQVLVLETGRVKVTVPTSAGTDAVLTFRGPGALLGEQALVDQRPRSANVVAIEPVELLVVAASTFRAYLARHPDVALAMLAMLSTRLRDSDRRLAEFAAADTLGRVSARLVELCDAHGEDGDERQRPDHAARSPRRTSRAGRARRSSRPPRRCARCARSAGSRPAGVCSRSMTSMALRRRAPYVPVKGHGGRPAVARFSRPMPKYSGAYLFLVRRLRPAGPLARAHGRAATLDAPWTGTGTGTDKVVSDGVSADPPVRLRLAWVLHRRLERQRRRRRDALGAGQVGLPGLHAGLPSPSGLERFVSRGGVDVAKEKLVTAGPVSCCTRPPTGSPTPGRSHVRRADGRRVRLPDDRQQRRREPDPAWVDEAARGRQQPPGDHARRHRLAGRERLLHGPGRREVEHRRGGLAHPGAGAAATTRRSSRTPAARRTRARSRRAAGPRRRA